MRRVGIIDVGSGTLRPVEAAFQRICRKARVPCAPQRVAQPDHVLGCDLLVLASDAAFGALCRALAGGMDEAIRAHAASGKPLLAISAGMQALLQSAQDEPGVVGLGVFAGTNRMLSPTVEPLTGAPVRAAHVGWNRLVIEPGRSAVLNAIGRPGTWVYFAHRYHAEVSDRAQVAATTELGAKPIVAALCRDNVLATQFRPERSHRAGIRMLAAFVEQS